MESDMMYMSRRGCAMLCIGSKLPLKFAAVPGSTKEIKTLNSCLTQRTSARIWRLSDTDAKFLKFLTLFSY